MSNNIASINYPTPDSILGDMSATECSAYRAWFAERLNAEYPNATIIVTARDGRIEVGMADDSDPADSVDEVHSFGNRCWETAPDMTE